MTTQTTEQPALMAQRSAVVDVVEELSRRIREGRFATGQRLPTVRQMGHDFGVSANTVAAALGILESQKVLVRRQRRGIYVRQSTGPVQSMAVGLITPQAVGFEGRDSWESHVTLGCFSELVRRGHQPQMLQTTSAQSDSWLSVCRSMVAQNSALRGIVFTWSVCGESELKRMVDELGVPVIKIGRSADSCKHNFVSIDHFGAGRTAGERAAHRLPGSVLVLSGPAPHDFPRRRLADGLINRLQEARHHRLRVDIMTVGDQPGDGERAMLEYLADNDPPRLVFSIGDLIAIDAMHAAQSKGLRVPEDVAFIGSAGLDACRVCRPTLAHTQQPMEQLGIAAVDLVEQMCQTGQSWASGRELPITWVDGGSLDSPTDASGSQG